MEVDPQDTFDESDETNNLLALAFNPVIEEVTAKYDGDGRKDVIGRFFAGVPVEGQQFQVKVNDDLAAVRIDPTATYRLPGNEPVSLTMTRQPDGRTFVLESPNVDWLFSDVKFRAEAKNGDQVIASSPEARIDVVPLPKWLEKADDQEIEFHSTTRTYTLKGSVANVRVSNLFQVPATVPILGGLSVGSFSASLDLGAVVSLNPNVSPTAVPTLEVEAEAFDTTFLEETFSTSSGGPFTATLALDGRTANVTAAVFRYVNIATFDPIEILKDKDVVGTTGKLSAKSNLVFYPAVRSDIQLEIDTTTGTLKAGEQGEVGTPSGSYASVSLEGGIGGSLAEIGIVGLNGQVIDAVRKVMTAASAQGAVVAAATKYLLDKLKLKQYIPELEFQVIVAPDSKANFTTTVLLDSGGYSNILKHGSFNLHTQVQLVFTWATITYPLLSFDQLFGKEFSTDTTW